MTKKRQHPHAHLLRLSRQTYASEALPAKWPGVADLSLAAPDMIKFDLAEFAAGQEPGKSKLEWLEKAIRQGPLGFDDQMSRHWSMEEFFWHGLPGDREAWHPVEAYLAAHPERFPPPAQTQLRRWKEARVSFYEVGEVADNTLGLQEWDPLTGTHSGPPVRVIALSMGGVRDYRGQRGQVTLTYVAPWSPEEGIYCAMGYGFTIKKRQAAGTPSILMLGLRQPDLICRPYPWKVNRDAGNHYLREWKMREWHGWLKERLTFPFQVFVRMPPKGEHAVKTVTGLVPMEPAHARQMGLYVEVPTEKGQELMLAGLTAVLPCDLASPNWSPIAEYHEYRKRVGPPPGTMGQPAFSRLR